MAASTLLNLSPLRQPTAQDRRQLAISVRQQIAARRMAALHQLQLASWSGGSTAAASTPSSRQGSASYPRSPVSLHYQLWGMQFGEQPAKTLTSLEAVGRLFQQSGGDGRLLVLGESGSGKSQTLLGLGEWLLQKLHPTEPVPVLLDLSCWRGEDLRSWLIDQLWLYYRAPQNCAQAWVDGAELVLLLDGFDVLSTARQRSCATALDTILRSNPGQAIALCCQRQTLERTGITFSYFSSGIHTLPLAAQQVKDYTVGVHRPDAWKRIKGDKVLQKLARSPLLLNLIVADRSGAAVSNRQDLLQGYVENQLAAAQPQGRPVAAAVFKGFLQWLAQQLETRERIFFPDTLGPDWLPESQRLLYRLLLGLVLFTLIGLISGMPILGVAIALSASQVDIDRFPRYGLSLRSLTAESWRLTLLGALLPGLALALTIGLGVNVIAAQFGRGSQAGLIGAAAGLTIGYGLGLLFQSWGGLQRSIQGRLRSRRGMLKGLINGSLLVGVYGVALAIFIGLATAWSSLNLEALVDANAIRVIVALSVAFVLWASFSIQHVLIRLLLSTTGQLPLNLDACLREAVQRQLLIQVGSGFCFVHEQIRRQFSTSPETHPPS